MTSTRVYSQYKQISLFRLDFFFFCEDIVRKTFNINAEEPKFCSSTLVYFTLADLLETNKVQEAKFRDCH